MPLVQQKQEWYDDAMPLADGIVTYYPPEISAKGAAVDLDWWYEVKRELRKVPGRLRRATFANAIRGMYFYFGKTDTQDRFLVHTTDKVRVTTDLINYTEVATGLTGTKRDIVSYATVTLPNVPGVLWADGVDVPKVMNMQLNSIAALALPAGVTNARIVRFFKSRTILIDVVENGIREGSRMWRSSPNTYNDWLLVNGAGTDDYLGGGGHIVQAVEFNDTMCLLKEFRLASMQHTGDATIPFRIQDFPEAPGTLFPNSVAVSPRGVIYLAYDGIRLFDGQRSILTSSQAGFDIAAVAADQRTAVVGYWDQRLQRYLLAVPSPGASDNDRVWEFHFSTPEAQIIQQGQLYKRSQVVSVFGFFFRRTPFTLADLPVQLRQLPAELGDPVLSGAFPVVISGDYQGGLYEQELTTDDDGVARTSTVEFGPYPKETPTAMHLGRLLREVRFRGRLTANSNFKVLVRPAHLSEWKELPTVVQFSNDRFTFMVPGSGIQGEQFFIKLVDEGQYSWSRVYSMAVFGSHTGAFWKP